MGRFILIVLRLDSTETKGSQVPTVLDVIKRLLPNGSEYSRSKKDWSLCPAWPPDAFAVAATLISMAGCYAKPRYSGNFARPQGFFTDAYRKKILREGQEWARGNASEYAQRAWKRLLRASNLPVCDVGRERHRDWHDAVVSLLALADEAAGGIGFLYNTSDDDSLVQDYVLKAHQEYLHSKTKYTRLPHIPYSHCILVPPQEVCVQPKASTPQVGCSLRSMSHHLSLLPPVGEISANWFLEPSVTARSGPLNLLLVPFPYVIEGSSFKQADRPCPGGADYFDLEQSWLGSPGKELSVDEIFSFVNALIDECGGRVDGVVFPEFALTLELAEELALRLAGKTQVEFLVAGVSTRPAARRRDALPRNEVYTALMNSGMVMAWAQSKHHRWKLDAGQLSVYELHGLSSDSQWWENIDISSREVDFWPLRHGAVASTLICEDLARIDPVQTLIRAIGPNLVVALLMDGPQLERRWSGRYATSLADDPGCAVLTLNSLGLIRRAERGAGAAFKFALWKQPGSQARELELERGAHALLLELRCQDEENWTLDGRSDGQTTVRLTFKRASSCRLPTPPRWASYVT